MDKILVGLLFERPVSGLPYQQNKVTLEQRVIFLQNSHLKLNSTSCGLKAVQDKFNSFFSSTYLIDFALIGYLRCVEPLVANHKAECLCS